MRIDGRAWILLLAGTLGCGGSSVTVSGTGPDGKIYVDSQGGSLPPVGAVVSEKGV